MSNNYTAADRVRMARDPERMTARDYMNFMIKDFVEMRGDRSCGNDPCMIGGIGRFHGIPVTVLAQQKGRTVEENIYYRFGMPAPEGYRKAERLMKQAEKFRRPVIAFVDTPGAYPGKEAEERGQGQAIASCIRTMSRLSVPVISLFIGEGGSGGALAIGTADRLIMLENSIFSIISPEGFASILWSDSARWEEAADAMKLTAQDLQELGVCDVIVPEQTNGIAHSKTQILRDVDRAVAHALQPLLKLSSKDICAGRYKKLRRIGRKN